MEFSYEGISEPKYKVYAVTVTTRHTFSRFDEFTKAFILELEKLKSRINYLRGVYEYHEQKGKSTKLHLHGTIAVHTGKLNEVRSLLKEMRQEQFAIKLEKITDEEGWDNYIRKDIRATSEQYMRVISGVAQIYKKQICLFDD